MTPLCSRLDCTAVGEVLKLIAAEHKIELPTELEIKCRKGDLEKKIQFFWNFSLNSDPKAIQWDELHFFFRFWSYNESGHFLPSFDLIINPISYCLSFSKFPTFFKLLFLASNFQYKSIHGLYRIRTVIKKTSWVTF